jgi:class 3 adenylate cyclase
MARFAFECLNKMHSLVAQLEESLGPDTGELSMRFGIHSGPVTAGVLRGERSRFQVCRVFAAVCPWPLKP